LAELEQAGYGPKTQIIRLALDAYYNQFLNQQEVTVLSKKAAEVATNPEVVTIDGLPWLNLGSGLLADAAIQMIGAQFPAIQKRRNGADEWIVYEPELAKDYYATLRLIMIFKIMK
jgi:hypothetical protein